MAKRQLLNSLATQLSIVECTYVVATWHIERHVRYICDTINGPKTLILKAFQDVSFHNRSTRWIHIPVGKPLSQCLRITKKHQAENNNILAIAKYIHSTRTISHCVTVSICSCSCMYLCNCMCQADSVQDKTTCIIKEVPKAVGHWVTIKVISQCPMHQKPHHMKS